MTSLRRLRNSPVMRRVRVWRKKCTENAEKKLINEP